MLFLRFKAPTQSWTIGPTGAFNLRGADMLFPDRTEPVARFQDGSWYLDDQRCTTVECHATLSIQFENEAGDITPMSGLRTGFYLRGAYAFAGRERIAKLDPFAGTWFRLDKRESWLQIRILAVPHRP